jgi:heme-degrading monooxygenase HmoA
MSDQFPNDEKDGKPRRVVHIWSVALGADKSPELAAGITNLLETVGLELDGFVEGRVFETDDGSGVTVMTTWKTRHAWANAIWNQRVDQILELVQPSAKVLDVMCYERATIVPAKT